MLTTTVDGLWVLQVLSGIETLAPEMGLRPYLPSAESAEAALRHPIADELRAVGAITPDNSPDATLLDWLSVISRRDTALLMTVQTPSGNGHPDRILLARFAHWWVTLEVSGISIRLSATGTADDQHSARHLIDSHIERLCGTMDAADFRPVSLDASALLDSVRDRASLKSFMSRQRLDPDQLEILTQAADRELAAQASVVAIQPGQFRSHIDPGAVTIIDTANGRVVAEHVSHAGKTWLLLSPGSGRAISEAVATMLRRLPAQDERHLRKVV